MISTYFKFSMLGMLAVAAPPVSGDASVWAQWGLAGLVVGYVLWRDHQRERRMSDALEEREEFIRDEFRQAMRRMDTPAGGTKQEEKK